MLGTLLKAAGISSRARYIVFHCADKIRGQPYYESIDLIDAFHPQTILAWGMNGAPLTVPHGAPVRLRVERQLGYKHAKYVMRVEAVETLAGIGHGKGGFWEDYGNYDWYAGI
jgi:DMSO/TMAO reductase YedYZ molybdopterin-dependent catalytic subunit